MQSLCSCQHDALNKLREKQISFLYGLRYIIYWLCVCVCVWWITAKGKQILSYLYVLCQTTMVISKMTSETKMGNKLFLFSTSPIWMNVPVNSFVITSLQVIYWLMTMYSFSSLTSFSKSPNYSVRIYINVESVALQ